MNTEHTNIENNDYRTEEDSIGSKAVPQGVYYGVQSLRAAENFRITGLNMHPEIINARRRERIAQGSGTTMADVNRLMKQFEQTRKMMKAVAGGGKMKMPGGMLRRR